MGNEVQLIQKENQRTETSLETLINTATYDKATDESEIKQFQSENTGVKKQYPAISDNVDPGYQMQKNIGEYNAKCVATQIYGLDFSSFTAQYHGFDDVFIGKNKDNQFVIVEAKCSKSRNGQSDLDTSGKYKELSMDWINKKLEEMQERDPNNKEYKNSVSAKLSLEIQTAINNNNGNIHRLLIHTNVNTLNIIVSECNDKSNNFTVIDGFRYRKNI